MATTVKLSTIKEMVKAKMATDVTDRKQLPPDDRIIMRSKGTNGLNGCVYKGTDGNLYAIVGRCMNLLKIC